MSNHDPNRKSKTSRRQFLRAAAAGAAGTVAASQVGASSEHGSTESSRQGGALRGSGLEPPLELDVAIVGAGVAGCYAAYRIACATASDFRRGSVLGNLFELREGKLRVGLFDYSGRIGGRLLSPHVEGIPSYTSEFGGFRFNRRMHVVWDTAQHLGLTDEVFHFQGMPAQDQNVVYLRGKRLTQAEVAAGENLPYNVAPHERGMSPDDLETYAANHTFASALPDVDITAGNPPPGFEVPLPPPPNGWSALRARYQQAFKARDWATVRDTSDTLQAAKQIATVDGRSIEAWTWWALKRRFLSQEAVQLLEDSGGYNEEGTTGNVGSNNLYENFYFPDTTGVLSEGIETEWRHIRQGYSAIPGRLEEEFVKRGGQTFTNYQLIRFDQEVIPGGSFYELLFYQRTPGRKVVKTAAEAEAVCAEGSKQCHRVKAQVVILAIPRRSVQLLSQDIPYLQTPQVTRIMSAVGPVPAIRFFLAYDTPWWNNVYAQPANGRSTTDLGVRQFYYWFTEKDGKSLVLASYANGQAEEYWRGLQGGQPFDDDQGAVSNLDLRQPQAGGPRPASKAMALEAHRQLVEAIGFPDAPLPYYAHFQNWTKDPWGAGWHHFVSGFDQNQIIREARQPVPGDDVYFVGECWSNVQGWVQGAINSTESTLQCKLGLKWPGFLRRHGTWLGPGTRWLVGDETDPCLPEVLEPPVEPPA
ncbi:MAG: FAD-dependent oxidoreductase [Thermoanaerobaculia bacterium]|nr:FAD-dependent oxidoreductase [Thermoanaerobaculia bacterium]